MPSFVTATIGRIRRIVMLDDSVFEELRIDSSATVPAIVTTFLGLFMLGLGGWLWWRIAGLGEPGTVFLKSAVLGTVFGFAAWLVWLLIIYAVLRRISNVTVRIEQLLRTAGFASVVLALGLGMVVTPVAFGIGLFTLLAWAVTTQLAVERTIGRGGADVVAANLAGFAAWLMIMSLLATGTNQIGPGPFLGESVWDAVTGANVAFR
ncbi:MAG: hypothetical protein DWG82_01060 [Chloroflexi bacterium]|nr:hypothetical protein [Chloroflexota bacterium]